MEGISQELADELKDRINAAIYRFIDEKGNIVTYYTSLEKDIETIIQSYVLHEK